MLAHGEHEGHASKASKVASILGAAPIKVAASELQKVVLVKGPTVVKSSRVAARSFFEQRRWNDSTPRVANVSKVADHIREAQEATADPLPAFDLENAPADLKAAVQFSASYAGRPQALAEERKRRFQVLEACARQCNTQWEELKALRPQHIAAMKDPAPHTALLACCARALEWPDCVASDFTLGFQQVGWIPACGALKSKPSYNASAIPTLSPVQNNLRVLNSIKRKAGSPQNADALRAVWDSSLQEVRKGTIYGVTIPALSPGVGPTYRGYSMAELLTMFGSLSNVYLVERFGVFQKNKCRACDDYNANGINDASVLQETISCIGPDFIAMTACMFAELLPNNGWKPKCFTEDIQHAYRVLGGRAPCFATVAQWDPERNQVAFFIVPGLNFGLKSAVNQFNRVPALITAVARRVLGIPCGNYFDDYAGVEPDVCGTSAQLYLRRLHTLLGVPLAAGPLKGPWTCPKCSHLSPASKVDCAACGKRHPDVKSSAFDYSNVFLGVTSDLSRFSDAGSIRLRVPAAKLEEIAASIAKRIYERELSPADAAKLRGSLQFLLSWSYGRLGKAAMQPIAGRQFREGSGFTPAIEAALKYFQHILSDLPDCVMAAYGGETKKRPILVWSDAAYEQDQPAPGTLGFVVFVPSEEAGAACTDGVFYHSSEVVSDEVMDKFVRKRHYIGQLEILAAVAVYSSCPDLVRDRDVIHWIDNTSAMMALIKGFSSLPDSARLVHAHNLLVHPLRCRVWFEHVVSEANVADMPSRLDFEYLLGTLGSQPVEMVVPRFQAWHEPFSDGGIATEARPPTRKRARRI